MIIQTLGKSKMIFPAKVIEIQGAAFLKVRGISIDETVIVFQTVANQFGTVHPSNGYSNTILSDISNSFR